MPTDILKTLLTRETLGSFISVCIACFLYFPTQADLFSDYYFILPSFIIFVVIVCISSISSLQKLLLRRSLASAEIQLRKIDNNYNFYKLPKEGKEEIDKIDEYVNKRATSLLALLFTSIFLVSIIFLHYLKLVSPPLLTIGNLSIPPEYVILLIGLADGILAVEDMKEIEQYMFKNMEQVYYTYRGTQDDKRAYI